MEEPTQLSQDQEIQEIPIATLLPADSPRRALDNKHVRAMAEIGEELPPIIVDRVNHRVVDGMHRLHAAQQRGAETIAVRYFDGDKAAAFVLAVQLNSGHGLPLTLCERKHAALRIISYYPEWSDRAIAAIAGLSDKTVGAIRRRAGASIAQPGGRISRNNEYYPLTVREGRLRATELFGENPAASTREVAKLAGISATTAKDVRSRLRRGENSVPTRQRANKKIGLARPSPKENRPIRRLHTHDRKHAIDMLKKDPSLRFSESGRILLRLLESTANSETLWGTIAKNLPGHRAHIVADLARQCSEDWQQFAATIENNIEDVSIISRTYL